MWGRKKMEMEMTLSTDEVIGIRTGQKEGPTPYFALNNNRNAIRDHIPTLP